jgi:hypothetical protein
MVQDQDRKRDAVAVKYLPFLRFSEEFSSVDERYLAEVTRFHVYRWVLFE